MQFYPLLSIFSDNIFAFFNIQCKKHERDFFLAIYAELFGTCLKFAVYKYTEIYLLLYTHMQSDKV